MPLQQLHAQLRSLRESQGSALVERLHQFSGPVIGDVPDHVRGFRVRLDLLGARPPVWRRLELPGDLPLDRLHDVIQAAMGWFDEHLHRFRTGSDYGSPSFLTPFDVEEGEDGALEDGVRLDQLLTDAGDRLWYEYDFGDGWEHVLKAEAVMDEPPAEVRCLAGRMACPPEDCGGIWGYAELAAWVRGGCDPSTVPGPFEDAADAREWLPLDWDPDLFDLDETQAAITAATAEPVAVTGKLAVLQEKLQQQGNRLLTLVLARPESHAATEVSDADAARLVAPYATLLEAIGEGVGLTGAGYLPPALVEQIAEQTGITAWWIGKANREDQTWPVAQLRASARALGLLSVRKGRLLPTAAARRCDGRAALLWRHIVSRLPAGTSDFDRQAGWLSLAVVGSGTPPPAWDTEIGDLLFCLGWQAQGSSMPQHLRVDSPTLDVLEQLAGRARQGRLVEPDTAVAATARAVIARRD